MRLTNLKLALIGISLLGLTLLGSSPPSIPAPVVGQDIPGVTGATGAIPSDAAAPKPSPEELVVPAGTHLRIRLDAAVSTAVSRPGDHFSGTLASPVKVNDAIVLPRGAQVGGYIVDSAPSGRIKGHAQLTLRLNTVMVDGKNLTVSTRTDTRTSAGHRKRNAAWIGSGAGSGLLIGALAGGPVGAVIGAGSGAAAGFAGEMITGRRQVRLPAETELTFNMSRPLTLAPVARHPVVANP